MDHLRELQLVELNILKEALKLFDKYHITYYALGGTMLGAVRHQGFIPWDDDIDIGVPRQDYDRLANVFEHLPSHLKFCTYERDPSYPYYFSRLEDERILVKSIRAEEEELTPAWIDIFPLDGMPNSRFSRKLHGCAILAARMFFQISRFSSIVNIKRTNRPVSEKIIIGAVRAFHLQRLVGKAHTYANLDKTLRRFSSARSDYFINGMGAYKLRELHKKSVFGNGAQYSFEDVEICGPQDYDSYLTQLYGDWRTPADFTHHKVVEITVSSKERER